jgi:hypothetical protein
MADTPKGYGDTVFYKILRVQGVLDEMVRERQGLRLTGLLQDAFEDAVSLLRSAKEALEELRLLLADGRG